MLTARPQMEELSDQTVRRGAILRIAVFLFLFFAFSIVGQIAVSVLPRESLSWGGHLVSMAAALAAGWIVLARMDRRSPGALGFYFGREAVADVLWGLLLGAALIAIVAALVIGSGGAVFVPDGGTLREYALTLIVTFAFFAVAAAWEELLFRGYAFQALAESAGPWPAILISSAIFAALHSGNPNIDLIALLNIGLAGVLLALAYLRTRSLWFATALHLSWNWTMSTLLDFPVSGLIYDTPLYSAVEAGPDWWTGGEFGFEAGVASTLVLTAGCAWLYRSSRLTESARIASLRPLVDGHIAIEKF